jgi:hypothetical protein
MEQKANDAVRRLGEETGLAVADVQAALGKNPGYYADFSHFTDEGAERAAAALARVILEGNVPRGDARTARSAARNPS